MDQRALQVSKGVEEVLQASYALLEAREQDEGQPPRTQPERPQESELKHLLLCHRQANGACERFLMDLQHAGVLVGNLKTQGAGALTLAEEETQTRPGAAVQLPTQYAAGIKAYDEAVRQCLWTPPK